MSLAIRREILVDRPVEEVWRFVAEPHRELLWRRPEVVEASTEDGEPQRVGSRVRGMTEILGRRGTYVNEVVAYEPPLRVAWRGIRDESGVVTNGSYLIEPVAGGCRVTIDITYEPVTFTGRMQLPMVRLLAPRTVERHLRQLKEIAEASPEPVLA